MDSLLSVCDPVEGHWLDSFDPLLDTIPLTLWEVVAWWLPYRNCHPTTFFGPTSSLYQRDHRLMDLISPINAQDSTPFVL